MTKLDEKLLARDESKQRLLSLRREVSEKTNTVQKLSGEIDAAKAALRREQSRLVAFTEEVRQLLHADLASVVSPSESKQAEQPSAEQT